MSSSYADLFNKLLKGELSPEETELLVSWLGSGKLDPDAEELIIRHLQQRVETQDIDINIIASLNERLSAITAQKTKLVFFERRRLSYAAVFLLVMGTAAFFLTSQKNNSQAKNLPVTSATSSHDPGIQPGRDGAILTLANGRTIVLDSLGNGVVATENGSKITLQDGQLHYGSDPVRAGDVTYNLISTPRGRQFQLTLSDGTEVWLNSGSSLRYPVAFAGQDRQVEITGEAYFEVAKDAAHPFKVKVNDQTQIEVLGTHFNVNSYLNESSINTTLLEGSIRLVSSNHQTMITPGQQAQVTATPGDKGKVTVLSNVNTAKVMAWKNGVFDFENANLQEVMRQLERWYDVDVVYEKGEIPPLEFYGRMGRNLGLPDVLRGLQVSKVHFKVEGRKLIVLP